jgi:hypothetical protein
MKFSLCLTLLLLSELGARENPFFPVDEAKKQTTSNIPDRRPQLGAINYTFGDNARILKEVTFTVQNLDGTIEEKSLPIEQSIDWHKPLTLSQQKGTVKPPPSATNDSSAANFGFVQLYSKGKNMTLKSSAPLERHFALTNPNRIVLDFKYSGTYKSERKELNAAPYLNVSLGNHGKFARTVITLDGRYRYTLNTSGGLISITCH